MTKRSLILGVALVLAVLLGTVSSSPVGAVSGPAQTAQLFVGAVGTNDPVFRYDVGMTGVPTLDLTLDHPTFSLPGWFAFSPAGEMFVMNHFGGVSRFLDPRGTPVFNGAIGSSEFANLAWSTFRDDELFVTSPGPGTGSVLRFTFDEMGNAVPNGAIDIATGVIEVNPATDELFAHVSSNRIGRFLIDPSGNVVPNGFIEYGGLSSPHDIAFSPWGELFMANGHGNNVLRFVFDEDGNASANGQITTSSFNLPLGMDFSPWGELFVANRNDGLIHRWVFDDSFNAAFNGSFLHTGTSGSPSGIHDLQFVPPARVEIDIKPGSDPNSINVENQGVIPVAILSTEGFDASSVVASSVRFGPGEAQAVHGGHIEDVSEDGVLDLVLHFDTQATGVVCGDTSASLTGLTFAGQMVEGADAVRPVPCK